MKVQLERQHYPIRQNKIQPEPTTQPAFKGVSGVLNYFATNTGVGACSTDLGFMVLPRTGKDMTRGVDAGIETGVREGSGTTNHALIGTYGALAGSVLGGGIYKAYDVKAKNIYTSPDRVNELAKHWENHLSTGTDLKDYLSKVLDEVSGYNTAKNQETGYVKILKEDKTKIVNVLNDVINNDNMDIKNWRKSNERGVVTALITESTGADSRFKLANGETSGLKTLLDDIVGMTKAFKQEKVTAEFNRVAESGEANKFLKSFAKFNKGRALAGFAIASGIGLSVQPFNMWLTKKRTGNDGFVGSSDGSGKDTSFKFKMEKLAVGAWMLGMSLAALNCKPRDFLNKMAFQGMAPTLNQLKGIYGLTVTGRVLVTRNEDELRESAVKDTCGYLSWLVLGDFVNRGFAAAFKGKELLNFNKTVDGNAVTGSALKSRSEVLREALRSVNISTIKKDTKTGLEKAMSITEMIKELETNPLAKDILKATKSKLRVLNIAQIAGYAFTGVALGLGIPTLNIHMTKRAEAKRREKAEQDRLLAEQTLQNKEVAPEPKTVATQAA